MSSTCHSVLELSNSEQHEFSETPLEKLNFRSAGQFSFRDPLDETSEIVVEIEEFGEDMGISYGTDVVEDMIDDF